MALDAAKVSISLGLAVAVLPALQKRVIAALGPVLCCSMSPVTILWGAAMFVKPNLARHGWVVPYATSMCPTEQVFLDKPDIAWTATANCKGM